MKKIILALLTIIFTVFNGFAQKTEDLYMNRDQKKTYENESRSFDGKPGKNYFVNKANYKIFAEFDPKTRILTGEETITYFNNSKDSLKYLGFNLYQDILKKGNARDWDLGGNDITDGVEIKEIIVNNDTVDMRSKNFNRYSTTMRILLEKPVIPQSSTIIKIKWSFILAEKTPVRCGTYEDDNFLIAYWYPKIAVYDDVSGWNMHGYTGRYEFYNDNGNYDVEVTIPKEYNAWATGLLLNIDEVFSKEYVKRIEAAKKSNTPVNIITAEDRRNNDKITVKGKKLIWKFKSEETPDFAFGVSKSYFWDGVNADAGDKNVFVNVVYKPESEGYKEATQISKEIIEFYSKDFPAIPYPYPQITVFNGGGGMEFPGMVNDGTPKNREGIIYLTAHEIGHSYFPFYTGLNEQKYAWMDEGLISFLPLLATQSIAKNLDYKPFDHILKLFNHVSGTSLDMPLYVLSENTGLYAYRFHAYTKPAIAYYTLYKYMGADKFKKALQIFTERWHGKHPAPFDFFIAFNDAAGEDLAWYWKPWFYEFATADLFISNVSFINGKTKISIKNIGGLPIEVNLTITLKTGETKEISRKSDVWKKGNSEIEIILDYINIDKLELDTNLTPDINPDNNVYNIK